MLKALGSAVQLAGLGAQCGTRHGHRGPPVSATEPHMEVPSVYQRPQRLPKLREIWVEDPRSSWCKATAAVREEDAEAHVANTARLLD